MRDTSGSIALLREASEALATDSVSEPGCAVSVESGGGGGAVVLVPVPVPVPAPGPPPAPVSEPVLSQEAASSADRCSKARRRSEVVPASLPRLEDGLRRVGAVEARGRGLREVDCALRREASGSAQARDQDGGAWASLRGGL